MQIERQRDKDQTTQLTYISCVPVYPPQNTTARLFLLLLLLMQLFLANVRSASEQKGREAVDYMST